MYRHYLKSIPNIGDASIHKLLDIFGTAENVYRAVKDNDSQLEAIIKNKITQVIEYTKAYDLRKEYETMLSKGINLVTVDDEAYPMRLRSINPIPYGIYFKGSLPENDVPSVAIIGARDCSEYGIYVADSFGRALGRSGINVISGMARGIDGISQRGALKEGGSSYGILGNGVDICYPSGNMKLYNELMIRGGIISAFPPGTKPEKRNFPQRNKIVAALADIVLVIEARLKSGTSITVDMAVGMNKDVFVVPGRVTDRLSDGCNLLIKEGAEVALSPEDILKELAVQRGYESPNDIFAYDRPKEDEMMVGLLKYMDINPIPAEKIHEARLLDEPDIPFEQTLSELVVLCVEEKAYEIGTGFFAKKMR